MKPDFSQIIRNHSSPLEPVHTNEQARLVKLDGVRAVLFDVYGTMLISGSGDVGTAMKTDRAQALIDAFAAIDTALLGNPDEAVSVFTSAIGLQHQRSRNQGVDYPEIDILAVWREVLAELALRKQIANNQDIDVDELAVQFEVRANPVWPMPWLNACLDGLRASNKTLGIISNAQFFTLLLFPALIDHSLEALSFDPQLCFFSYRYGRAKPGLYLYELARQTLDARQINPSEVLYIGNDMLNDVMPAQKVGFRTALFAGDGRSLRWRVGDPRIKDVEPDVVVTNLNQILECI